MIVSDIPEHMYLKLLEEENECLKLLIKCYYGKEIREDIETKLVN